MNHFLLTFLLLMTLIAPAPLHAQGPQKNTGLQLSTNPPMEVIARTPPPTPVISETFETRPGFTLIDSLDDFRLVLECGGHRRDLTHSTIENHTKAKIILNKNVRNCTIKSLGPVENQGENNTIIPLT